MIEQKRLGRPCKYPFRDIAVGGHLEREADKKTRHIIRVAAHRWARDNGAEFITRTDGEKIIVTRIK